MQLWTDGKIYPTVNAHTIETAVREAIEIPGNYVVLERARDHFMQAAPWVVEVCDAERRLEYHFNSDELERIVQLFVRYASDDPSWRRAVTWQDITDEQRRSARRQNLLAMLIVLAGGAIIAAVVWKYMK